MKYTRKTKDCYIVQGNYGYGWEDLTEEATRKEARIQLLCYNINERNYPHRLIVRREKIERRDK